MPNWTPEQKKAIYEKDSNILIAAAAGSGKTAVLVERIINKIVNEKIDIDKLLVVTFTNAAASEMRERILDAIYKKIDEIEDEAEQDNLRRQITLLNKASICTIDSFCLDVIRNNFYEIDISPNFRIADSAEIDLLKQEVLEELFEEKYETQNKDFEELIKTYTSYRDDMPLKELVLKIYTYIESSPFPEKWINDQIEKFNIKDIKKDFSQTMWGKILLEDLREELIDNINTLKAEELKLSVENDLEKYYQVYRKDIESLEAVLANLDSWDKTYALVNSLEFIKWPISKVISEEKEKAKKIRDTVKKKTNKRIEKVFISNSEEANTDILDMYKTLVKLKDLILDFKLKFTKKKKGKNIVDFSDIEHFALEILDKKEVQKKYRNKFVEIAIDEYQDSNLVQEYILTSISNGNNIYMVGDVKQSIYKFRQAVPELFLQKYKNYKAVKINQLEGEKVNSPFNFEDVNYEEIIGQIEKNGEKIQLYKNFRSRKNVLDFTNIIFENIMSEKLGEIDYLEEEFLNLGANFETKDSQDLMTEIDIIDLSSDEDSNKLTDNIELEDDNQDGEDVIIEDIELEAKFVAQKIRELVKNRFQVYDNKKGCFRDIKYKDIVILLRSTKIKAPIFEKELINQNIPVFSDSTQEYLTAYEIQTIMSLLKIIDNPLQDIPLVMALKSPIYNFTDDELVEIRLADKYDDFYTALVKSRLSVDKKLKDKIDIFLNQIEVWREKKEYLALDELIWNIYEETQFFEKCKELPNGALRQANLKVLFERAKQYETASFKGLFNFINFMERVHTGSGDLSAAKLIGENEDVVRIMSIHKSKGLEFPIVFLANTNSNFNFMDLNNDVLLHKDLGIGVKYINYDMHIKYDTLSKQALRNKLYDETLSEEMRILYVALTRAKEKLFIVGTCNNFDNKNSKIQEEIDIYKKQGNKINPILVKKYKNYLDWIVLVGQYNKDKVNDFAHFNIIKKMDFLKCIEKLENSLEEKNENDKVKIEKQISDEEDLIKVEYKYKIATTIPTKTSVTAIVSKNKEKLKITNVENDIEIRSYDEEESFESKNIGDEIQEKVLFELPNFLRDEAEVITSSKKGTLVHLFMKKLDFSKEYDLDDIKEMINELKNKQIIIEKESQAIDPYRILEFTKTDIFKSLKEAKEIHKEEPFYLNVPAREIYDEINKQDGSLDKIDEIEENILVQGIIDLYYIDKNNRLILLDYKTDYVAQGEEEKLIEKHKDQLKLYKRALENSLKQKVDKIYIYSVYLGKELEVC